MKRRSWLTLVLGLCATLGFAQTPVNLSNSAVYVRSPLSGLEAANRDYVDAHAGGDTNAVRVMSTNQADTAAATRDTALTNLTFFAGSGLTNTAFWMDYAPTNAGANWYRTPPFPQNATVRGLQGYVTPGGTAVVQVAWQNATNAPNNINGIFTSVTLPGGYSNAVFTVTATNGTRIVLTVTNTLGFTTNYLDLALPFTVP